MTSNSITTTVSSTPPSIFIPISKTADSDASFKMPCSICLDNLHEGDKFLTRPACGHFSHNKCYEIWIKEPKTHHEYLPPAQREKTCAYCRGSLKEVSIYERMGLTDTFLHKKNVTHSTTPSAPAPQTAPVQQISAPTNSLSLAGAYGAYRDPSIYVDIRTLRSELAREERDHDNVALRGCLAVGVLMLAAVLFRPR